LLRDLSEQSGIESCHVIVTLNLADEVLDVDSYPLLALSVVRNSAPRGFGANHNAAFARCQYSWFVVMNPDIRLPGPYTLESLIRRPVLPSDGLLAPLVLNPAGGVEDSIRLNLSPIALLMRALGRRKCHRPNEPARRGRRFFWAAGMCMVVSAEAFRRVRGFDERFFLYCEDYDLCARMYLQGYSIELLGGVSVIHEAQRDSHRSSKHLRWHLESLVKVWLSAGFWRVAVIGGVFPLLRRLR
jgi:GT2 family glycosyltransferase